jgi:hypothetical protein
MALTSSAAPRFRGERDPGRGVASQKALLDERQVREARAISRTHIAEFKGGKVIRVREYLDPKEALEAVGLSE